MHYFLKEVAEKIAEESAASLAEKILVFPNRRSALYFRRYLSMIIDRPSLMPSTLTINQLMSSSSAVTVAEQVQLVTKLYEAYTGIAERHDSFDEFYFWGEMLVNDFDDIDKYRIDPSMLFRNLRDLKDIDARFGGYEPEVLEVIREFWLNFESGSLTPEKQDFLAVWDILMPLYDRFRELLGRAGLAYEGMVMREFAEGIEAGEKLLPGSDDAQFHFIGFNALNRCEKDVMLLLKRQGRARFYWDYDRMYTATPGHEAGLFIAENMRLFGQDIEGHARFDNLLNKEFKRSWEVIRAPSDVAQAKLLPELLSGLENSGSDPDRVAVILADENLLMPVLNSLPSSIPEVNITMGYPVSQTPVSGLVDALLSLRANYIGEGDHAGFYHQDVLRVLSHQYIAHFAGEYEALLANDIREQNIIRVSCELLEPCVMSRLLFDPSLHSRGINRYLAEIALELIARFDEEGVDDGSESMEDGGNSAGIQQEYLLVLVKALNQLNDILEGSPASPGDEIYRRVLDRAVRALTVPFEGEPLAGLQVMGVLETRALDFEHIIFLSVNEGILPRASAGNSYIPYNLRMAFGLPTIKHQDSIYAYYFYRLLQRSKSVRFLYNSNASGTRTGEMSRFLLQLRYSAGLDTKFTESRFNIMPQAGQTDIIERTSVMHEKIAGSYLGNDKRILSPSALNTWISCRMRFYYRYVAGLSEPQDVTEEVDAPLFGTILHEVMNRLYEPFRGGVLEASDIEALAKDSARIGSVVEEAFRKNFMSNRRGPVTGRNLIITSVIRNMAGRIMAVDTGFTPLRVIGLEEKTSLTTSLNPGGGGQSLSIGGVVDRIDKTGGTVRIIDYKSGRESLLVDSVESLTAYNEKKRNGAAFQTFLYTLVYSGKSPDAAIRPSLYPVRSIYRDDFDDHFVIRNGENNGRVEDFRPVAAGFYDGVRRVLADLFDPSRPFDMTTVKESCTYCPYKELCNRNNQ